MLTSTGLNDKIIPISQTTLGKISAPAIYSEYTIPGAMGIGSASVVQSGSYSTSTTTTPTQGRRKPGKDRTKRNKENKK